MNIVNTLYSILIYSLTYILSTVFVKMFEKYKIKLFAVIGLLIPVFTATFRTSGIDFETYKSLYYYINAGGQYDIEIGWYFLNVIAPTHECLLFLSALLFYGIIFIAIIRNSSRDLWLSWFILLITSTGFFYNGTRQSIAMAFFFCGYFYLYEKKWFKFLIMVLLSSLFHYTGILAGLFFFFYWLIAKRIKKIEIFTCIIIIALIVFFPIIRFIMERYDIYLSYLEGTQLTYSFGYLLYVIPPLFFYYKKIKLFKENKLFKYYLSIYLLLFVFQVFGMMITFADRMAFYFQIIIVLLVPRIIEVYDGNFKGNELRLYYILWFILHHVALDIVLNGNGLYPYILFV